MNPLLATTGLPAFDQIQPKHVEPGIRQVLQELRQELEQLEQSRPDSWSAIARPLEAIHDRLARSWGVVHHLLGVHNSEALRQAHDTVHGAVVAFGLRLGQSQAIYQAVQQLDATQLNPVQQRLRQSLMRDAELSGVALTGAAREQFNTIQTELAELSSRFSNAVLDAGKAFALDLDQANQVAGLPESLLALCAQNAREAGHQQATAKSGPWRITLDLPCFIPFMQHAQDRSRREQLYRAYISRAAETNAAVIERILRLRQDQAELLGYTNYAELSLASKMAGSVAEVDQLLDQLAVAARPIAKHEHAELHDFARAHGHDGELRHWDITFWAERLREQRFAFTDEQLRPYFPLPRVLDGLFGLIQRLFAVRIEAADGQAPVWHPDVHYFQIHRDQQLIAGFYLEPYSRPAEKRGGAWMDDCLGRRWLGNQLQLPVAHLCCNGTPPVDGKPSLLSFDDVEALFHECGHGLQHLLTTCDEALAAGINNVEWDAVELPSHFLENWAYDPTTLSGMARHVDTNEALPAELKQKILASRSYRAAWQTLRQVQFARIDLRLHERSDRPDWDAILAEQHRVGKQTALLQPLPEDRTLCAFGHLFAGGYAAGYYSYKWAEVLAADAYAAFTEVGTDHPQALAEVGARYRDTVLALGGSCHPLDIFRAFRGREPRVEPLLRQDGLLNETQESDLC